MKRTYTSPFCYIFVLFLSIIQPLAGQIPAEELPKSGLNVNWVDYTYFTSALPFTDAIKQSSGFHHDTSLTLDEHGYPVNIPEDHNASLYIFLETTYYPTGDYTLQWEGEGTMLLQTCQSNYEFDENSAHTQTISITDNCEGGIILYITATNPHNYIRNLHLYLPGYTEQSGIWTDHYVTYFSNFELIRFAWGAGMYSNMSTWSERRQVKDLSWAAGSQQDVGVPYEAMIELANRCQTDLWVCVPVRANDAFERNMATMMRDSLNNGLRFWMEWGNEQWNCGVWGYEGCVYLQELIGSDTTLTQPQLYARETIKTAANFTVVFDENDNRERLIRVLGAQTNNPWVLETAEEELNATDSWDQIDVVAIAPYFNGTEEYDPLTPVLDQGMDAIMDAVAQTANNLFDPLSTGGKELRDNAVIAARHQKPLVAYEGGQHFTDWVGVPGETVTDINRHPDMYDIYTDFLTNWEELGGSTFVHFNSYGDYTRDEAFGLKEYYNQPLSETHKLRAIYDWTDNPETPAVTPIGERFNTSGPLFTLYPNPASHQIHIQPLFTNKIATVRIRNINGQTVKSLNISSEQLATVSLSHYQSGIYIVELIIGAQKQTKKLIVQ